MLSPRGLSQMKAVVLMVVAIIITSMLYIMPVKADVLVLDRDHHGEHYYAYYALVGKDGTTGDHKNTAVYCNVEGAQDPRRVSVTDNISYNCHLYPGINLKECAVQGAITDAQGLFSDNFEGQPGATLFLQEVAEDNLKVYAYLPFLNDGAVKFPSVKSAFELLFYCH